MSSLSPPSSSARRPWPRRLLTVGGLWVVISLFVYSIVSERTGGGPSEGDDAALMMVPLLGGGTVDLTKYKGQTMVLDFWATWCKPCARTLPAIQQIHRRYAEDPRVAVFTVNMDDGLADRRAGMVSRYVKHYGYDFTVLMDEGAMSSAYKVRSIPLLVVVDPEGRVHAAKVGAKGTTETMVRRITEMVETVRE